MLISKLIGIAIVVGIIFILYKKGIINNIRFPIIKNKFVYDHHSNGNLSLSYGKYNGVSNYPFFLQPGHNTKFRYQVEVQEGAVELTFKVGNEVIFNKEFFRNEEGDFSFVSDKKTGILIVTGKYTKGSCNVQIDTSDDSKNI